uniref:Uncharacterized protein n=1 Tax=Arundo donax TaxID=35708 RepID=A0A0A9FG35_ARUDO
MWQASLVAAAS